MFSSIFKMLQGKAGKKQETTKPSQAATKNGDQQKKSMATGAGKASGMQVPNRHRQVDSKVSRGRRSEAAPASSRKDIDEVLKFSGRVLTAPGESLELNATQRRVVAILENGVMVADKANRLDPNVLAAMDRAERQNLPLRRTVFADLDVIRRIYEKAASRSSINSSRDVTRMEKDFLDLVQEAAAVKASDIYIKVSQYEANVDFGVNGVVRQFRQMPADYSHDLLRAAFAMSKESDASYQPQEIQSTRISRDKSPLPQNVTALRLQYQPLSGDGRRMVARLLYHQEHKPGSDVHMLGYCGTHVEQIREMRRRPYGINVISGPTGSGKSTTLQMSLSAQMEERNHQISIITIEDPPEYDILGAAQVPILNVHTEEERRQAFVAAISSALRSAPHIIMVGEVRDSAASRLSFESAMTGHQVWTTVHSNNAISIIDRFRDWGVEEFKLTDETLVTGLVGQRLVRVLCKNCCIPLAEALKMKDRRGHPLVSPEMLARWTDKFGDALLAQLFIANEEGCDHEDCDFGHTGRTVIAECVLPDATFMDMMRNDRKREATEYWIQSLDGIPMLEHAAAKVISGLVDPRESEIRIGNFRELSKDRLPLIKRIAKELE